MKILLSDENIRRAHEEFKRTVTDPETRRLALAREKFEHDRANMMETGRVQGLEEGRAEGRAEGAKNRALETASRLLARGISAPEVAEIVGLSEDEIAQIRSD